MRSSASGAVGSCGSSFFLASALLFAGCASVGGLRDAEVMHLTRGEIVERPSRIEGLTYLSTGQPDAAVLDAASAAGYVAVIDLRAVDEPRGMNEQSEVEARGMRYISIPVATPDDATFTAAARFAGALEQVDGPVLMHCTSGNRVGSLFALGVFAEGGTADEAMLKGEQAGLTRWREAIAEKLDP